MGPQHFAIYCTTACTLEDAAAALGEIGVDIDRDGECLTLSGPDLPRFSVRLFDGEAVATQARDIAARFGVDTREAQALTRCSRCLRVDIEDFDEALDEINTMMEVQAALQDATGGVLYLSWNGHLSLPYAA